MELFCNNNSIYNAVLLDNSTAKAILQMLNPKNRFYAISLNLASKHNIIY